MADQYRHYGAVVTATALTTSRNGKDGVAIRFAATDDLDTGEAVNKAFKTTLWLTDAALTRTIQTLREIGWTGASFAELNDPDRLRDTPVEISVGTETWDGNTYDRVKFVHAPGDHAGRGIKPAGAYEAAAIASKYDSLLAAESPKATPAAKGPARQAHGRPQQPQPQRPQPTEAELDELPF